MSVQFVAVDPKSVQEYEAPPRDPRDSDLADRRYRTFHRMAGEFQAGVVDDTGRLLDEHPADALERGPYQLTRGRWIVDANTAGLIVQIADKLNDVNRERYLESPVPQMCDWAWKLVSA